MKKIIIFILLYGCFFSLSAQLTIDACQEKARENYPLIRQYELIEKSEKYSVANANRGYLPQVSFSGKASYQSDVTQIDLGNFSSFIDIDTPSKDQYQVALDINQTIWDGGNIRAQKKAAQASAEAEKQKNEVDLFTLQERINQIYFGILLLNEQLKQNEVLQNELEVNYKKVTAYIRNGVANQSDLDEIKVEQLKSKQQQVELQTTIKSYKEMLSAMIGEPVTESTTLQKPDYNTLLLNISDEENNRPEFKLFEAQEKLYSSQMSSVKSVSLPKISLYAQGGYGRPGFNMLKNDFEFFYIAGIRLAWNISGFYTQKNNLQDIEIKKQSVDVQKASFIYNNNLQIIEQNHNIEKLVNQLKTDDEIITLRKSIKKASEVKVENGTLSISDLLRDINAENLSLQDKSVHEIQLLIAIYNLKLSRNN